MSIRLSFQFKQAHSYVLARNKSFLGFHCVNMASLGVQSGFI